MAMIGGMKTANQNLPNTVLPNVQDRPGIEKMSKLLKPRIALMKRSTAAGSEDSNSVLIRDK